MDDPREWIIFKPFVCFDLGYVFIVILNYIFVFVSVVLNYFYKIFNKTEKPQNT